MKLASLFIGLTLLTACGKFKDSDCELWEVTDREYSVSGCIDWSCGGSRTLELYFCGAARDSAFVGNTVILRDDQCCKKIRTFNRKV